jgi:hypothetical protein
MILVQNLLDEDAHAWPGDWYRNKARETFGSRLHSNFRLWYTDYANHADTARQVDPTRTVSYVGVLHQALRDVAAWAERGVTPPDTTGYRIDDGQVVVAATAAQRKGIQPVVALQANGAARADVRVGEQVEFTAVVETPPNAGSIVAADWDFEGDATSRYPLSETITPSRRVSLSQRHAFTRPGTYFPTLRAISQRDGDQSTPYARIHNLGRVRVVVT